MNSLQINFIIFITITISLLLASLTGFILKKKINHEPHAVIDNLNARINAWWVMLIILYIAISIGDSAIVFLFGVISFFALREFITLLPTRRDDYSALAISFYLLIPCQYYLVHINAYNLYSLLIPLYAFLLIPILILKREDTTSFLARSAKIHWGLMVCVYCISHVPALLNLEIIDLNGKKIWLIIWLILVVQLSDVFQYICGKIFGKHKLAPILSPSKTLEGLIGGIGLALTVGVLTRGLTPFTLFQSLWISLTICLFGFLGGLVMSAIKRDRGVKDWGDTIQGHGGILDRMDSLCFSAPVFFHILKYWWT